MPMRSLRRCVMRIRTGGMIVSLIACAVSVARPATTPPAAAPQASAPAAATESGSAMTARALPGAPADGVVLDYLVADRARHRVWVPAGGTGSADVIDTRTQTISRVENFPVAEVERGGKKRKMGPSSATVGDGVVYVGDRADSSVCAVDATTLERRGCATLSSMPDGVVFVARTKEVWVTTP